MTVNGKKFVGLPSCCPECTDETFHSDATLLCQSKFAPVLVRRAERWTIAERILVPASLSSGFELRSQVAT
jgi:hypothetical protein